MARVSFKQRDAQALIRAAKAEGYSSPAVDKLPDGTLRLLTNPPTRSAPSEDAKDFWDTWDGH